MFKSVFKPKNMVRFFAVFLVVFLLVTTLPNARADYIIPQTVTQDDKTYYSFTDESVFYRKGTAGPTGNGRLSVKIEYTDNRFMLTEDNQRFVFNQHLWMQQAYWVDDSNHIQFFSLSLYNDGTVYENEVEEDTDKDDEVLVENRPAIGQVHTAEMVNNHSLNISWQPDPDAPTKTTQEMWDLVGASNGQIPEHSFKDDRLNITGNPQYYYLSTVSFIANEQMDTNFYYDLFWWRDDYCHTLIGVNIKITDVRDLIDLVKQIESNIADGYYNDEEKEMFEKRLATIPEGMLDGTKYYTQASVNAVYDYIIGVESGYADTEEYKYYRNKILELIVKDENGNYVESDVYTAESLAEVEAKFKEVDVFCYFPYAASKQSELDDVTNQLKNIFSLLSVINPISDGESIFESSDANLVFKAISGTYRFMQIADNQTYSFSTSILAAEKEYVSKLHYGIISLPIYPTLESVYFDQSNCSDCTFTYPNNTVEFLSRMDDSTKYTDGNNIHPLSWSNSNYGDNGLNIEERKNGFIPTRQYTLISTDLEADFSKNPLQYGADTSVIKFTGNAQEINSDGSRVYKNEPINLTFYWLVNSKFDSKFYHTHVPVQILLTDVRPLIELYDELYGLAYFSSMADERAKYSTTVISNLKTALAKSTSEYSGMLNGTAYYDQATVNAYYNELNNVLPKPADYTALDEAISRYEALTHNNYTEASIQTAKSAYTTAKAVGRTLDTTNQSIIDSAATNLNNALDTLVLKPADYTKLNNAISSYEAKNSADYTQDSWQTATTAYNEAKAIDKNLDITHQSVIDAVANNLNNAITNLVQNKANYTALDEAINLAKATLNSGITYTTSTTNALKSALTDAENVSRDLLATEQNTVNQLTTALNNAITGLLEKADYTAYNTALQNAKTEVAKTDLYTADSISKLQAAITEAEALSDDLSVEEQEQITEQVTKLNNAVNALKKQDANYTALDKAIADYDALVKENYTTDSLTTATNAYNVAKAVDRDLNITQQTTIDNATKALNTAINSLELKLADYTAYTAKFNELNAITNDGTYTNSGFNTFKEEIQKIDTDLSDNLTILEQSEINEAIAKLETARTTLEANKKANYENYNAKFNELNTLINDGKYSETAFTEFKSKVQEINNGLDKDLVDTEENRKIISNAITALESAKTTLETKKYADYSALNLKITKAQEALANATNCTEASKNALSDAITSAQKLVNEKLFESDENNTRIANEVVALETAINGLKVKADYTGYNTKFNELNSFTNDGSYSESAFNTFKTEIARIDSSLNKDLADTEANRKTIEDAITALNNAKTSLENNSYADYTRLNNALTKAEAILNDGKTYTDVTKSSFDTALKNAKAVEPGLLSDKQDYIDSVAEKLEKATNGLKVKADYTAYNTALQNAKTEVAKTDLYTTDTILDLQGVITEAELLSKDLSVDEQNQITERVTNLNNAVNALEKQDANYTAYNVLLSELQRIISTNNADKKYVATAFETFKTVVTNIDNNLVKVLKIDKQKEIDDAIIALNNAKTALDENRRADYSEYDSKYQELTSFITDENKAKYDSTAWEEYTEAVKNINDGLNKDLVDNAENRATISNAITALESAKTTLETKKYANCELLDKYIADANSIKTNGTIYTNSTLSVLNEKLSVAEVLANEILFAEKQQEIDETANALKTAIDGLKVKADYTGYNTKFNELNSFTNDGSYSESAFNTFKTEIARIDSSLNKDLADTEANRKTIEDAITALNNAKTSLENNSYADYTRLNNALTKAEAVLNDGKTYTDVTKSSFDTALKNAKAVEPGLLSDKQDYIDSVADKLEKATNGLKVKADYTAYNTALQNAKTEVAKTDLYTTDTILDLQGVITEAELLSKDLSVDEQNQITEQVTNLNNAVNALEKQDANYTAYNELLYELQRIISTNNADKKYVATAFETFKTVVTNIDNNLVKVLKIDKQKEIDDAIIALNNAKTALDENRRADYSEYDSKYQELTSFITDENKAKYDSTAWEEFTKSLKDINDGLNKDLVDNAENRTIISNAITALESAKTTLETKKYANYNELNNAITNAESILNDGKTYTQKSKTALEDALTKAKSIEEKLFVGDQNKIDSAKEKLVSAINEVKVKADYSELNKAILDAKEQLKNENYTDESRGILSGVIGDAEKLDKDLSVEETEKITEKINAIKNAVKELKLKSADYSKLDKAILEAKAIDSKIYTNASLEVLEVVLQNAESINRNLFITEQNTVDQLTDALNKAVSGLKVRADYVKYNDTYSSMLAITNENGIYSENAFNTFKTEIARIDSSLNKDLADTEANRKTIEDAITALNNAKTSLENNSYADYTRLNNALTKAEAVLNDGKTYTDVTKSSFDTALKNAKAVEPGLLSDKQDYIDSVAEKLEKATNGLKVKADYTAYNTALQNAKTEVVKTDLYTVDTISDLEKVIEDAEKLNQGLSVDEQNQITEQVTKLNNAVGALKKQAADYSKLNRAIKTAESKEKSNYTDASWSIMKSAYDTAKALPKDLTIDRQSEVDVVEKTLTDAINGLKFKSAVYTALDKAIASYEALTITDYTESTIKIATDAYNKAKEVDRNLTVNDQAIVDDLTVALNNAIGALELKKADYSALDKAITDAKTKTNDGKLYTKITLNALKTALKSAELVDRDLFITEQGTIDNATSSLVTAIKSLKEKVDYSELHKVINTAEATLKNSTDYTEESKKVLSDAIEAAKNINDDLPDTEENRKMIAAEVEKLKNSMDNLRLKPADYSELDKAITDAESKLNNGTVYTDNTIEVLNTALKKANKIDRSLFITDQKIVDETTKSLVEAITSLKEKADYSDYNRIFAEAQAIILNGNNSQYDEIIWNDFVDIVGAVDEALNKDLSVADQAIVDEATTALNEAMKKLYDQRKADYSKLDSAIRSAKDVLNDGKVYTSKSETNLKNALKNAEAVDRGLFVDNQSIIDEATDILNKAIADIVERADYTEIEDEVIESEEILSEEKPEDDIIYTTSSKNALQEALLAFENLDEDLPVDKQYIVTEIETDIEAARIGIKIKADYTKLDKAVAEAEELLSLDVEHVDLYRIMLENTLVLAENVHRDLSTDDQSTIDNVTGYINYAMDKLNRRADYSEYDAALSEIKDIVRKGYDGSCDYKDWDEFVATVTDVAVNLPQNLPVEEQAQVDKALEKITDAREIYESKKYIVNEEQQGEVVLPTDPENPESVSEPTELIINSQSTARKEDGLLIGLPQGTTVAELLTQFNNDSAFLLVKDMNGECITAESLIATGMTIELVSKDDIQVILEKVTVVVKGDVTGDGLVNREDYKKSFNVCFGNDTYSDSERAFFEASDTNGNGRIDINDVFNISNLRLFVSRLYALCISD